MLRAASALQPPARSYPPWVPYMGMRVPTSIISYSRKGRCDPVQERHPMPGLSLQSPPQAPTHTQARFSDPPIHPPLPLRAAGEQARFGLAPDGSCRQNPCSSGFQLQRVGPTGSLEGGAAPTPRQVPQWGSPPDPSRERCLGSRQNQRGPQSGNFRRPWVQPPPLPGGHGSWPATQWQCWAGQGVR